MSGHRFRDEVEVLDERARAEAPGQFVRLSDGMVHYEIAGPPDGHVVVLVPGFSVPYFVWDPTFEGLVEAGFRVLRYDLYGRGYSDRPETVYGRDLFDRQLVELLEALGVGAPVGLVGLSMGGAIVVVFAARHREMVRRLCLVDPAGLPYKQGWTARVVAVPLIGDWVMDLFGGRVLVSGMRKDMLHPERFADKLAEYEERYRRQMRYRGFKGALLSTLRSGILTGVRDAYEEVGRHTEYPVLLVWGREDHLVPFSLNEEVRRLIPRARLLAVEEAGHGPHFERPEVVTPALVEFMG